MFNLEIVSHVWNYSRLACYQLSSLILYPPAAVDVTMTVFYCPQDGPTLDTLTRFTGCEPSNVSFRWWPLERTQLLRRAIGRNTAAKTTTADAVLFADCDYCYGPGCLDAIPGQLAAADASSPLFYPRTVLRSKTHALGDAAIAAVDAPGIFDVNREDFEPEHPSRAIGGIQLVRGDVAREHGYLGDSRRWQRPADEWKRTYCDKAYRRSLGTNGEKIDLPNMFRIRHALKGRFDVGCSN